jgi:hypothetical protein
MTVERDDAVGDVDGLRTALEGALTDLDEKAKAVTDAQYAARDAAVSHAAAEESVKVPPSCVGARPSLHHDPCRAPPYAGLHGNR